MILNIILSRKDRYKWEVHCKTDCKNDQCISHPSNKEMQLKKHLEKIEKMQEAIEQSLEKEKLKEE